MLGVPAYYLIVLACPVMMFFMMSSMSGGNTRGDADAPRRQGKLEDIDPGRFTRPHLIHALAAAGL